MNEREWYIIATFLLLKTVLSATDKRQAKLLILASNYYWQVGTSTSSSPRLVATFLFQEGPAIDFGMNIVDVRDEATEVESSRVELVESVESVVLTM